MPKQPKALPTVDVLRRYFRYDEASGRLINLVSRTNRKSGAFADSSVLSCGYRTVYVSHSHYYAHRVVWALHYGDTLLFIDHINGDFSDNRIDNLRECTHEMNSCNRKLASHNTTGTTGVHKRLDSGKYRVYLSVNKKRYRFGQYDSKEEAESVAESERKRLHGEYFRDSQLHKEAP
jgi:HNH endonuclease